MLKRKAGLLVQLVNTHKEFDKLSKQLLLTLEPTLLSTSTENPPEISKKSKLISETLLDSELTLDQQKTKKCYSDKDVKDGTNRKFKESLNLLFTDFHNILEECNSITDALPNEDLSNSETELDSVVEKQDIEESSDVGSKNGVPPE